MNIEQLIKEHSHPELAEVGGMVYQVWEDGEITLQKCGPLLWQRSLHMVGVGIPDKAVNIDWFDNVTKNHGNIFTDEEGAKAVSEAIQA